MPLVSDTFLPILAYTFCSTTLALFLSNQQQAVSFVQNFPCLVGTLQCLVAVLWVGATHVMRCTHVRGGWHWHRIRSVLYYAVASAGLYLVGTSQYQRNSGVALILGACCPCVVAVLDRSCLGRARPTTRSRIALALIVLGACGYHQYHKNAHDDDITNNTNESSTTLSTTQSALWSCLYLVLLCFEVTYGKMLLRIINTKTISEPVAYTNLLGLPPLLLLATANHEVSTVKWPTTQSRSVLLVLFGACALATAVCYSSWWCRDQLSATSFAVVAVTSQCVTLVVSHLLFQHHGTTGVGEMACLLVCLVGASLYRQAPLRSSVSSSKLVANAHDDVWEEELSNEDRVDSELEMLTSTSLHASNSDLTMKRRVV
jgi:hypothetical protein